MSDIPIPEAAVRDPRFIYGSEAQKIQTIEKYRQLISEFDKVRELQSFLEYSKANPDTFSKLMSGMNELQTLLDMVNKNTQHVVDNGTYDRIHKLGSIYNNTVSEFIKVTHGVSGVSLDNIHEIYSPLKNGRFDSILNTVDRFVAQGMLLPQALEIAESSVRRTQELSQGPYKLYDLIDTSNENCQAAISALSSAETSKINFWTPTLSKFRQMVVDKHTLTGDANSHLQASSKLSFIPLTFHPYSIQKDFE